MTTNAVQETSTGVVHRIAANRSVAMSLVFAVALAIRLFYALTAYTEVQNNDSTGFHNLAINVVAGNGYTCDKKAPYNPYFMREPGYSLFLAGVYYVYDVFGPTPQYLASRSTDLSVHGEIVAARLAQAVVGAASCVIVFMLFGMFLRPTPALVIALLFSLYLPLAAFSALLLRETLQAFLVISMSYAFARFLLSSRLGWLALFTVLWALSNLVLQTTVLLFVPAFIFCWIWFRKFWPSLGYAAASSVLMILLVSPWLLRTYNFYPDVRVFKTFGTSQTFEGTNYVHTQMELERAKMIPRDTAYGRAHRNFFDIPEREKFDRSYNGYYEEQIRQTLLPQTSYIGKGLRRMFTFFRRSWMESLWMVELPNGYFDMRPHAVYRDNGNWPMYALSLFGFIFGYAALPGIVLFSRWMFPALLLFVYFLMLIPVIGDEPRRFLPVHALIFLFSCLFLSYIYLRLVKKVSHNESRSQLFQSNVSENTLKAERVL